MANYPENGELLNFVLFIYSWECKMCFCFLFEKVCPEKLLLCLTLRLSQQRKKKKSKNIGYFRRLKFGFLGQEADFGVTVLYRKLSLVDS